jgi:ribosome-associated protein
MMKTPYIPAKLIKTVKVLLDEDKAQETVVINLNGKTSLTDYIVIASGSSQRHVGAMADHLSLKIKECGISNLSVEGKSQCDWVLIDAGDVIIHLFCPEVREFYNIEKMWGVPLLGKIEAQSELA